MFSVSHDLRAPVQHRCPAGRGHQPAGSSQAAVLGPPDAQTRCAPGGQSHVHSGCKNKHIPSGETQKAVACHVKEQTGAKECASCVLTKLRNQMLGSMFVKTQLPYQICPHG